MNVIKHIICELTGYRPGTVYVSQGDRGSRAVSCRLLENGAPWMIPEGAAVRVAYTLPDGTEGLYDALPDGSPAGEIAGNTVTVELADQIMDQAGMAQVSILVLGPEGGQLATWPIRVMVRANKAARLTVPEHMPPYGAGFSGKIFFGGADGTITPLALGEGVAVERLPDGSWQLVGAGSGIAKETDPTVPEWAKQTNKPSYTAQEVGALPAGTKIPAKTSDLSNDSGFVTKAVNDLANYYTKAQTQELLAAIPRFRVTVVQQLPAAGEELVLYLVPFATAEGQFLEYIWVGGRWEVIGSQRVDLTGYATEAWVLGKLSALDVGSIQIGGGDGIRLESEGTASAPVLVLYGAHGDEPVRIAQVAPAQADGEAVPLGQAKQLVEDVVPSWAMADSKPGYTKSEVGLGNVANERQYSAANPPPYPVTSVNGKAGAVLLGAQDVMAEPVGAAASAVRAHNTNDAAHNDIRLLIDGLATRLNALANSTDTDLDQMAEIVAYIKSNKSLLDGITTSKVSVADIVNNLTTNVANRPLSAAQGVALKALFDKVPAWALATSKPGYTKSDVGLGNVDNVRQYSVSNPPPYPVTSVNGQTGAVTVDVPTKVSQLTNDSKFISAVTAAMVTAALGYTPINPGKATLGRHDDGLLYLFVNGQPVGSGVELPNGGIDGYITEDKQIVFSNLPDGEYTLAYLMEDGSVVTIGELVKDTNTYYSVTSNLTNCTSSNAETQVAEGGSYSAVITANSGYELKPVKVTMGGVDITATAVSGGKITIAAVSGDIVVTAVATQIQTSGYTNLFDPAGATLNARLNSSAAVTATDGYVITNFMDVSDKTPFTASTKIYMKGVNISGDGSSRIFTYNATGADYTNPNNIVNMNTVTVTDEGNGVISISGLTTAFASSVARAVMCLKVSTSAITEDDIAGIVITIDEPIV